MKKRSLTSIVLSLSFIFSSQSLAFEEKGVYVNHVHSFIPGAELPITSYTKKNSEKVLGPPKKTINQSLSLGHHGEVIIGYLKKADDPSSVKCFVNGDGWDIMIHEPKSTRNFISNNREEDVDIYITKNKIISKETKWHFLGRYNVVGLKDNLIKVDMNNIKFGYWVKLKDAGSKMVRNSEYSGFDASAVILRRIGHCDIPHN